MEILSFGSGRRLCECERILKGEQLSFPLVILLPIPTTRDNEYITDSSVRLNELGRYICPGTLVVGYDIPEWVRDRLSELGASVFDAGRSEDFLEKNAIISARGAIGRLLCDSDSDLSEQSIGIIGYGRIGKELCRSLLFLGASVTVYTTRASVATDLVASGVRAELIGDATDLTGLDILINTAPARLFSDEKIGGVKIMDLASGSIFPPSASLTKLSSIPEKMYPRTAGRLYAEAIINFARAGE